MGGATLGSTIPGVGTLAGAGIGAGLGLLGGMFGGGGPHDQQIKALQALSTEAGGRQAPMLGPASLAGNSSFRGNQQQLVSNLEALSQGRGPSLASEMLNQNVQNATANQTAMAAGARGNPALAQRQAMNNAAMMTGQAAQQAQQARVAEQLGAMNQLGLAVYGARGQDESLGQFNAGAQNQMAMANAENQLRFWAQNDQARLQALQAQFGPAAANAQAPGIGDYLMAFGGGLGQQRAQAQQARDLQAGQLYGNAFNQLGTATRNFRQSGLV